ncbi:MAG: protease pro-enzyme activation domain-containing protein [Bryobacteraceae bacterium]
MRIDENVLTSIPGTTHPLTRSAIDAGRAVSNLAMNRMLLMLKSTPAQSAALDQLIAAQHDPASPLYRQWLTTLQFGEQFGPAQEDLDTIVGWLESKGFHVAAVANGRRSIEFSGSAAQVERAFHTEMHHYVVDGVRHLANATDISIPSSLTPVVAGVKSLHDFYAVPLHRVVAMPGSTPRPLFDPQSGGNAIAPGDFATIYNVAPLYSAGIDGTGQTIAVVGRSNFTMSDVSTFRSMFGLPVNNPQIVLNGQDPGILSLGEEVEALLDVQWSGAVAKNATIDFVLSASTNTTDGVTLSAQYIVDANIAPVLSISFGLCEALLGELPSSNNDQFFNSLWQQAAAQGISVIVAAGDSGSAGCDNVIPAVQGFGVNGIASTPWNTAIGGTQLNDTGSPSTWWSASNSATGSSALSYIPEIVWNQTNYAGGGGVSTLYPTPSWQTGDGVPSVDPNTTNQHHRYVPDVSLSAALHDPYVIIDTDETVANGGLIGVGGTSAAAPSFAGIVALLNQHEAGRVGNPAATLYSLASQYPSTFQDVVTGTNAVPCVNGSPNCIPGSSQVGIMAGWSAAAGFDLATGLGSVNAYNMVMNWPASAPVPPVIASLAPNPMPGSASSQTLTIIGSGFQSGLKVVLTSSGSSTTYQGSQVASVTASQIQVSVNVGVAASTWSVQVTSNGKSSNSVALTVNALPPPVVSSLGPNPMTASTSSQTLTINGSGFQSGAGLQVQFTSSGGITTTYQGSQVSYQSSSQLQVSIIPGSAAASFTVKVVNPSGLSSVPVNFSVVVPTQTASTPFVTGYALSGPSLRNDFTGWVGMKLTVGASPLIVSSLGRICVANNALNHTVKFVNASIASDVSGASVSVSMAGCAASQFVYAAINPVTLAASTSYYLVSQETQGGDLWYDQGGISTTTVAAVNNSIYFYGGNWNPVNSANTSYVPPGFQYTTNSAPQYLLTTTVSPAGSGSIVANPSSANGSYTSGTPVQLTAAPSVGCTFVNWTGALTGTTNPQTVTMSGPQSVTASFQCTAAPGTAFVTGYASSGPPLRNDFTGWVGMKLTVGANPITVSSLGRICVANNTQAHTVKFVNAGTASDVTGASASVSMAGCTAGQFVYTAISPATLTAGASFYLVSQETQGGDRWYDQGAISAATVAAVNSSVYFYSGNWYPIGSANSSYVPPNFQYTTGGAPQYLLTTAVSPPGSGAITASPASSNGYYSSGTPVQLIATPASGCTFSGWSGALTGTTNPQTVTMSGPQSVTAGFQCAAASGTAFVTGYGLSGQPLRNDFTGWVGMKLTLGSSPLSVSSVGRICLAGNAQAHAVKFVNAITGVDVPGASASVNMGGCTAGQFVYSSISPVTLPAGTSYFLASQETQGGDSWYDQGLISTTAAASVNSSVYFWGGNWIPINTTNTSYVPPSFLY